MKFPRRFSSFVAISLFSGVMFASVSTPNSAQGSDAASARSSTSENASLPSTSEFVIPGPQRSFLRMAGISQKVTPDEVLPLLSRNIFTQGYEGSTRPTEFLVLLRRYVVQAKELTALAAETGMVIRVTNCDDARPLLRILGYRTRANCGQPENASAD